MPLPRQLSVLLGLGLSLLPAVGRADATARAQASYDLAPLLALIRPAQRPQLARQSGLTDLRDLPLYELDLALDEASARLAGRVVIHFKNRSKRPLAVLPLLLHPNAPRELGAAGAPAMQVTEATAVDGPQVTLARRRPTLVELRFARPLAPGERVKLRVSYSARLRPLPADANDLFAQALSSLGMSGTGSAASDYGLLAVGDGLLTLASAYPMVAPYGDGRFDTSAPARFGDLAYNELAHFKLRTVLPKGYQMVSNLVDQEKGAPLGADQVVFHSAGAAVRDLVLVAGRKLVRKSRALGDVRVTSVYLAEDAAAGARVLATAHAALRLFEERFGPYPYTELDVVESTLVGGAGGVEFSGMVLIAGMLYRKPSQSGSPLAQLLKLIGRLGGVLQGAFEKPRSGGKPQGEGQLGSMDQMIERMALFTVAHEVAHQYFAGLVGIDCRRHAALDEPLAQYAAGEYAKHALGKKAGEALLDTNAKLNYGIYRLLGGADLAAAQPLAQFPSSMAYAAIVYGKAPYFYAALEKRLGAPRLRKILRAAVDRYRFRLVTVPAWTRALDEAAGGGGVVTGLARRWLHGAHGDADLGVDESGETVLRSFFDRETLASLKRSLAIVGMHPKDLFRLLMGNLMRGQGATPGSLDPEEALKRLPSR
ncbi:MAG: hypothetical protein IT371_23855 [Deltaproteobacteria bacterium]|nr:hypothetical protein [Deltaproteobacteria bacterium]